MNRWLGGISGNALAGDDSIARNLVLGHGGHGNHRGAVVLVRDRFHAAAHVVTGHEVVAEENEEGLTVHLGLGLKNGMAQTQGLVLVDEGDGKLGGVLHGRRESVLAARLERLLQGVVLGKVLLDRGLLVRVDDNDAVDAIDRESLLDDLLNNGQALNGEKLLGDGLGRRKETRAETSGGNDCLHDGSIRTCVLAVPQAGT